MKWLRVNSDRGIATLIALIMVGMLVLLGLAALSTSDDEVLVAGNNLHETQAFYAAESGLDIAAADIQAQYETSGGKPPEVLPSGSQDLNGCTVEYTTTDNGAPQHEVLSTGTLSGLHAAVKSYTLQSVGFSQDENSAVRLKQTFKAGMVPIFQFAVFYNDDIELSPSPEMTLIGRMHTNGDMYLESSNALNLSSYVTAAGSIYHGNKIGSAPATGDIYFKNAKGKYVTMEQGSDWLDANDAYWYDSSIARWNGRVQDQTHGQQTIDLLLAGSDDPRRLIEPAAGNSNSYELKADLKFVNNQAFKKVSGAWVDVTADMVAAGIVTYTTDKFYDAREAQNVDVTDLDIQKLYATGYGPANGIIYFFDNIADPSEFPALRLQNASEVGAPLTIAANNPVYTVGNFNTTSKKSVSILSDALTFLSAAWDDTKGALNKNQRDASATTVNLSFITGDVVTSSPDYNGGFENLPRLLESWTNKILTWKGSAANLWNSTQAVGLWNSTYYNEPKRNWSYDTDLDIPTNLPPGTPSVQVFQRVGWHMQHAILDAKKFNDTLVY